MSPPCDHGGSGCWIQPARRAPAPGRSALDRRYESSLRKRIASRHLSCDLNRARARKRSFTPMAPSRGSRDRLRPLIRASATERSTTARPPVVAQVERTGCPMCVYKFGRAEMGERVPDSCGPPDRIRRRPGHGRSPLFHQRVDKPPPAAPALDLAGPPRRGLHGDTGSGGQDVPSPQSPPPS
jgi:hypothetical protein